MCGPLSAWLRNCASSACRPGPGAMVRGSASLPPCPSGREQLGWRTCLGSAGHVQWGGGSVPRAAMVGLRTCPGGRMSPLCARCQTSWAWAT